MPHWQPRPPLIHAAVRAPARGQGDFYAPTIIALRITVVIVRVRQPGEVICQPTRGRCNSFVQRRWSNKWWWRLLIAKRRGVKRRHTHEVDRPLNVGVIGALDIGVIGATDMGGLGARELR
jgi:hypothetical protein